MRRPLVFVALSLLASCAPEVIPPPVVPEKTSVELYSWWSAPSEAGALDRIFDIFRRQNPNVRIVNGADKVDGTVARAEMRNRVIAGNPPDLFLLNPRGMPLFTQFSADGGTDVRNTLAPVDEFLAGLPIRSDILDVLSFGEGADRHLYSVPLNLHRQNAMFYNKAVFTRLGLTPPTSMAAFFATCDAIQAANAGLPAAQRVVPLAISRQRWITEILFRALVPASAEQVSPGHGVEYLEKLMFGRADPATDPEFRQAVKNMNKVLSCTNQETDEVYGWSDATTSLKAGRAAMFVHGDWVKGELVAQGAIAGTDFDVLAAFGAANLFLYNVDAFAVFSGAAHPAEARLMLTTMLSVEGQIEFNKVKGSSPARSDIPLDSFDPVARKTYEDFANPSTRILSVERDSTNFWDDLCAAMVTTSATRTSFWDKRKAHGYDEVALDADADEVIAAAATSYVATKALFAP